MHVAKRRAASEREGLPMDNRDRKAAGRQAAARQRPARARGPRRREEGTVCPWRQAAVRPRGHRPAARHLPGDWQAAEEPSTLSLTLT